MRYSSVWLFVILAIVGAATIPTQAQPDGVLQINDATHNFLTWQHAKGRLPDAFLTHRPLSAYEAGEYLDSLNTYRAEMNPVERKLLDRFRREAALSSARKAGDRYGLLYRNGTDFVSTQTDDYSIQVNPLLYAKAGVVQRSQAGLADERLFLWQNTRGLRFSGSVGDHLFFETRVEENQRVPGLPEFNRNTAPRLGNVKFDDDVQDITSDAFYDYFLATGIVGVKTRLFEIRFGRDRNLWGIGKSSVSLSNFSTVYDQLQLRTTVGPFQYINLFTGFTDLTGLPSSFPETTTLPRKYGTFHRLSLNVSRRVTLSFFEAVVFAEDSTRTGFEISFLNPVIFYRAVESDLGSSSNVVIGSDFEWLVRPGFLTYFQVVIDELRVSEVFRPGNGWWGNKWSWMAGLHVTEPIPGLENLRMRIEYARTRPFTFSHRLDNQGYVHYADVLAHPSGPNSEDVAVMFTYQPTSRIFAELNTAATIRGRNSETENFGADPSVSYDTRDGDFDHRILQGIPQNHVLFEAHGGYELFPNLFLEAAVQFEHIRDAQLDDKWYVAPVVMIRWGLPYQSLRY